MLDHLFSLLVSTGIVSLRKCSGLLIPLASDATPPHGLLCEDHGCVLLWDHSPVKMREAICETVSL